MNANVTKNNMTKVMAVIAMMAVVFAGVAVLASDSTDAADAKITYISGEINADTEFRTGTIVVVNGNLTVVNGATLSILDGSKFTVNEGVTLTVNGLKADTTDDKATFYVAENADVAIDGTITVGENGDLEVAGDLKVNGAINFQNGSESFTGTVGENIVTPGEVILGEGATMNVTSTGTKIGKIGEITVSLMPGATLNMRGMAVGQVTVNAVPADYASEKYDVENSYGATAVIAANPYDAEAKITSAKVSNITFTASAESATAYLDDAKVTVDTAVLDITGTVQNGDDITTSNKAVDKTYTDRDDEPLVFSSAVQVSQSLTVGKTATITVNSVLNVSGTVNVITNDAKTVDNKTVIDPSVFIGANAAITVTGSANFACDAVQPAAGNGSLKVVGGTVTIVGCDDPTDLQIGELYGAYYTAVEGINYTTYIMDLEDAIAAAAADDSVTSVYVYSAADASESNDYEGAYTVSEGFTVPTGVTLYVNNVLIVPETVEIIVPADAAVEAIGIIVVDGTVVDSSLTLDIVENGSGVVCEVTITAEEDATVTYTSLALAIAGATAGDVIDLAGDATIDSNLTIPADITVVVGEHTMKVTNGAVLTVDGVLNDASNKLCTTVDEKTGKSNGTVVVNNYIITDEDATYAEATYNVSGVYTNVDIEGIEADRIIVSVPVFAGYSANASDASVQGTVSYNEAFTLTAGETGEYALSIKGDATFGTVTLVGYEIQIGTDGLLTATVTADGNSVELKNIKGTADRTVSISNVIDADEETNVLAVSGTPAEYSNEASNGKNIAQLSAVAGTVSVDGFDATKLVSFGVSEGTTVDVDGTLKVSEFAIAGTVNVDRNGSVEADDVIVTGTLNVVNADTENADFGKLSADSIYIGTDKEFKAQNAATVSGDKITFTGVVYVSAESAFTSKIADGESVEFYVEDALWMTAYGSGSTDPIKAPVQDAIFMGWYDSESETQEIIEGNVIAIGSHDRVDAKIKYDIYRVEVLADNGVGTVAIDGVVLMKNSNMFIAEGLTAGSHTISIDVKNGYSADNVVIQVNGQTISGNTFTLSGTPETGNTVTVTVTVSGTEATVQEPVVVEDDGGMGITDYLLIILVILVIILAIFVALRMMRS